ncbi:general secretion pathway protein GspB [Vibrio sp. Of7-15]|uniref:general secretion pathway protein GspB n=1 Tax=Vibrio sp. Of7-15 TaxID=2724879 RepID=UPI001EF23B39|nr:general secretion pathway protein GspB [Vibrio sp. Of7-15]MCG7498219.1 general secretion pathway protein GspB [Vibrio sp. Of7-15]
MSNILSALEQSEQSYQQQSFGQHSLSPLKQERRKKTLEWLIFMAVVITPATSVTGYYWYQHGQQDLLHEATILNAREQPVQQSTVAEELSLGEEQTVVFEDTQATSSLTLLSYPEFVTEPLPARAIKKSVPVASVAPTQVADKPQVSPKVSGDNELQLDQFDLSQLSPDIAARLQNALGTQEGDFLTPEPEETTSSEVIALSQASSMIKSKLPALNFQTHIYASEPSRRWIKVNDAEVVEGDEIMAGVIVEDIQPRHVVISFLGQQLSIPALYEWQP